MKKSTIILLLATLNLLCKGQTTENKFAIEIDFNPTQFDHKSVFWENAEKRSIMEHGLSLSAITGYKINKKTSINLSFTKHKNTTENTYYDNSSILNAAADLFTFFVWGSIENNPIIKNRQSVESSSNSVSALLIHEVELASGAFIGGEIGISFRKYSRNISTNEWTDRIETANNQYQETELKRNIRLMLLLRQRLFKNTYLVERVGISNTPISIGIQTIL